MKNKRIKPSTLRAVVVLAVLLVSSLGYFTMMGIGNLSSFGWDAWSVLCPLGYLESLLASKTFVPRALMCFAAVVVLILVFGRVFCSWICPMPLLQRWIPGIKRKKKKAAADGKSTAEVTDTAAAAQPATEPGVKRGLRFRFDSRYGVLLGALASAAIFGFPVFCLVCPVGLTFALVFLLMRLFAFGDVTWTLIFVPAVLLIEVVFLRKWCHKICPLGAIISLISGANRSLRPSINDQACIFTSKGAKCFECSKACPEQIDIRQPELSEASLNNCTKCKECSYACPANAISFPLLKKASSEKKTN